MEHKTEYKEWLPRQGMSEESAVRYVRGISSILNLLKEQERIGVCDSGRDAVRLLDAYDAVTKDQKYFKKYMHYLCDGREVSAAALFVALKQLRAVFHRSEKGERDELLGAIHPNFESFLSSADRARLRNGASNCETRAQAYLLRLSLADESVIVRLE